MSNIRVKRVDKKHYEDTIEDFRVEGYKLASEGTNITIMKKHSGGYGHWFWHLVLLVCTWGIGNIVYAAYKYYSDVDVVEVRVSK